MDIFKKTSTIAYLVIALIVIAVIGFFFYKPVLTDKDGNEIVIKKQKVSKPMTTTGSGDKSETLV